MKNGAIVSVKIQTAKLGLRELINTPLESINYCATHGEKPYSS